ncbi:hypothetical protein BDV27DRAFT_171724 [Aspergillus caelatus]|uniref:VWFA domain-containing protein n=1 Tax=Aspergillus caelatus TaxID=61420 RepID=A0A5N7A9M6_9EURO|nr:uncharacterized protein BDV27DRAFT_171724 [Aspergillus caelatus]KAE8365290.1 hypothetical protein BDV27DRAFT_171724 [Aspergillus caelatus]
MDYSNDSNEKETFINDIIDEIVDQFLSEFRLHLSALLPEDSPARPVSHPKFPETEEDYREYAWGFIETNLGPFYQPGDAFVEELIRSAAARAKDLTQEYELEPEVTPKLLIMALYDFVILCDDSGSMNKGDRIKVLEDTCQRVAQIAGLLQPQGVYLRFLNHKNDRNFDNLTDQEDIQGKMRAVKYSGKTRLGTVLKNKIIEPLIFEKARSRQLERPIITVIVTDGCPLGEETTCLEETVLNCKKRLGELGFEPASAIFIISQVGDDPEAVKFLTGLKASTDLEEMLYCCPEQLDAQRDVFRKAGKDSQYSSYLIGLFEAALVSQADI